MTIDAARIAAALADTNLRAFLAGRADDERSTASKSAFKRHGLQPLIERRFAYAEFASPLRSGKCLSAECDVLRRAPVVVLLEACGPSAVLRRVRAVVVNPIKRVIWRALAHICDKDQKVVPAWGNVNSAFDVAMTTRGLRVVAAVHHAGPDGPQRMLAVPVLRADLPNVFRCDCAAKAAARANQAELKVLRCLDRYRAAVANALPPALASFLADEAFRRQHPKPNSRQVFEVVSPHTTTFVCALP